MREHPWLVARAFCYDKPRAELELLSTTAVLHRLLILASCVLLAFASGVIIWGVGVPGARQEALVRPIWAVFLTGLLSLTATFIYPSVDVPDTILFFLLLLLLFRPTHRFLSNDSCGSGLLPSSINEVTPYQGSRRILTSPVPVPALSTLLAFSQVLWRKYLGDLEKL